MHIPTATDALTDWSGVESTKHPGESGVATWQTQVFGEIRVRLVEYSAGYLADHWCSKGHIIYCLEGEARIELEDRETFVLKVGMSCQLSDHSVPHRASSVSGAKLFIVD